MPKVQDILVFFQTSPGLDITPSAWSRYEASKGTGIKNLVEETEPPYKNAVDGDARRMAGHPDERDEASHRRGRI